MNVAELFERVWRARHEMLRAYADVRAFHICLSKNDYEGLKDRDYYFPSRWEAGLATMLGWPIVMDEALKPGDVRLRVEVRA